VKSGDEAFRDTLPFALHRLAARSVAQATSDFAAMGLTVSEARVMIVTLQHEPIRVSAVAAGTAIELSTLSHMLGRLERDKLVKRTRDANDSRSVAVTLTPRGRQIAKKAQAASYDHQEIMLAGLTPDQIATLRALLRHVYDNVDATATGSGSAVL
jgi:DNA-binding MarR family transcriptional regulator